MTGNEVFTKNMAVVERRWPDLAALLIRLNVDNLQVELIEGLQSTLVISHIQLTSRHDRIGEAQSQAESLPVAPVIHLYGPALGELPRAILEKPGLERLEVRILNEQLFVLILQLLDQTDWLEDLRVSLTLAGSELEIRLPFFASPAELLLASDTNAKIRDRLVAEIDLPYANSRFDPCAPEWRDRLESNRTLLAQDVDVAELFASRQGEEAWVFAAGPTLAQHLPAVKAVYERPGRPLFIAVDTALRPLLDHDIRPDFVVSIDNLITARILLCERSEGVGLVYFPLLENSLLRAWKGQRYAAYSRSPLYATMRQALPKGVLHTDGSVLHPAVDLAVRMGVDQITLLGADFSFVGGHEHAWQVLSASQAREPRHWVLNGHGERVMTLLNLRSYLCGLERYIAAHPEVRFLNASKEGAWIAGADYHPEFVR